MIDPEQLFSTAPDFSAEEIESGRLMFARPCTFMLGVVDLAQLPAPDRVEICFAGRSNVGKSSLINALTRRKNLARASNTPGRTQEINFFDLDGALYVVDLPGYGYAEAPAQIVGRWQELLRAYLGGRVTLRRVYVLIDSRHGVKLVDHEIMTLLDKSGVSFQAVLTKADKPRTADLARTLTAVKAELARHPTAFPQILVTSSEKSAGIADLRAAIVRLARES